MNLHPRLAFCMAVRGLRRDASTTALSVAILALGLAAPATFASFLVGAVRPLPVPEGERVMRVEATLPSAGGRAPAIGGPDLEAWVSAGTLEAVAAFRRVPVVLVDRSAAAQGTTTLGGDLRRHPIQWSGDRVSIELGHACRRGIQAEAEKDLLTDLASPSPHSSHQFATRSRKWSVSTPSSSTDFARTELMPMNLRATTPSGRITPNRAPPPGVQTHHLSGC